MKIHKYLIAIISSLALLLVFTGCEKENKLDAQIYCHSDINYKLHNSSEALTANISDIIGNELTAQAYETIQINTNKAWTYGLQLNKVKFDVLLSIPANVDIDITISNLENGENYNSTQDTYFYHKTLSFNKECTSVSLDIYDIFINKDATISLEVVKSCYEATPELKISIANFQLYGEHPKTNY